MPKNINGSVGKGGTNRPMDVATVQYLLNCVPAKAGGPSPELAVDTICGPLTKAAILKFQTARGGFGAAALGVKLVSDGRVDPNGATIKALQGYDPLPNQAMAACMAANGYGRGTAAQKAASQAVIKAVAAAVAQAMAKGSVSGPVVGGVTGVAVPAAAAASVIKKAAEAAAKILEQSARQGGIPISPVDGPAGISKLAKSIADVVKKTAEQTAKQAKLTIWIEDLDLPNNPGFPGGGGKGSGGGGGLGGLAKTIAKVAKQAAEQAAKAGGKLPGPGQLTGLDEVPAKVQGIIKQINDTTNSMLDSIAKMAAKAAGAGKW